MSKELSEQLNKIKETLDKYKDAAHILTPIPRQGDLAEVLRLPPYTKVSVRVIWISPDKSEGEVYSLYEKPDDLILSKIGLQRLGRAAGISWSEPEIYINEDEPLVAAASIVGTIMDLDGSKRSTPGRASLDLRDNSAQSKKKKPGQLAVARSSIVSLVETGAKNKVRRELLGTQPSYKAEDLNKPFILFTLIPDQEAVLHDFPALRQTLAVHQIGLGDMLFQRDVPLIEAPIEQNLLPETCGDDAKSKVLDTSVDEIVNPKQAETVPGRSARDDLIIEVEGLYQRKVRGGRSIHKTSIRDLNDVELNEIKGILLSRPDLT